VAELLFQRASQVYLWGLPVINPFGMKERSEAKFGAGYNVLPATPDEIYYGTRPACRRPRFEPRPGWPRASPCAQPRALVKGQPGVKLELRDEFLSGRGHLPRVLVTRAA
jgi:hypothetical protein